MRSNERKRNSTHKDDRNGTSSLRTHDKCLLNVGRLAGSTDESAEAIISHLYLLIGLVSTTCFPSRMITRCSEIKHTAFSFIT